MVKNIREGFYLLKKLVVCYLKHENHGKIKHKNIHKKNARKNSQQTQIASESSK